MDNNRWTPEARHDLYVRAIKTYGHDKQWRQVQEECSELIADINRFLRGRISPEKLAEEIADVRIMTEQALLLNPAAITKTFNAKLDKLKARLDEEDQT